MPAGEIQKLLWSAACCCADIAKFGPGVPSALMIPLESRLEIVCPDFGTYVPNAWSNERFSPMRTMTCLIGETGCGSSQSTSTDCCEAQEGSPSEAARVTVTMPTFVQVKVALAAFGVSIVPELAVQL